MESRQSGAEQAFRLWIDAYFFRHDAACAIGLLTPDACGCLTRIPMHWGNLAEEIGRQVDQDRCLPDLVEVCGCKCEPFGDDLVYLTANVSLRCSIAQDMEQQPLIVTALLKRMEDGAWRIARLHLPTPQARERFECSAARKLEQTLQGITDSIPGGVCRCRLDEDFTLEFASEGFYKLFGYTPSQMQVELGNRLIAAVHPEDGVYLLSLMRQAVATGEKNVEFETRVQRRDGSSAWLLGRGTFVQNQGQTMFNGVVIDISMRKQAEQALMVNEQRLCIALEQTTNIVFDYLVTEDCVQFPEHIVRLYGLPREMKEVPDCFFKPNYVHPDDQEELRQMCARIKVGRNKTSCVVRIRLDGKNFAWNRITLTAVLGENGQPARAVGVMENISAQKESELAYVREERYRRAMLSDSVAYLEVNLTRDVIDRVTGLWASNLPSTEQTSYTDYLSLLVERMVHIDDQEQYSRTFERERLLRTFQEGAREVRLDHRRMMDASRAAWMCATMHLLTDPTTGDVRGIAYLKNIDQRKREELALEYSSKRDSLTGLLNKKTGEQAVRSILQDRRRVEVRHAVLVVDIDHFKAINDTYGHLTGDEVLREMSRRMSSTFRSTDILSRLGGDEFLIMMREVDGTARVEEKAQKVCQLFRSAQSESRPVSCSVGISIYPDDGQTFEQLYEKADRALYQAKHQGRNCYAFYSTHMQAMPADGDAGPAGRPETEQAVSLPPGLIDALHGTVYLSDPHTHQLLYINRCMAERLGITGDGYQGRMCYELLHGRKTPCPGCNNRALLRRDTIVSLRYDDLTGGRYLVQDQLVEWQGRQARMELALDVTGWMEGDARLEEPEYVLLDCMAVVERADVFHEAMQAAVDLLGSRFGADRARLVQFGADWHEAGEYFQWQRDGVPPRSGLWTGPASESKVTLCAQALRCKRPVVLRDVREMLVSSPLEGIWLDDQGIRSLWALPLIQQDEIAYYLVLDNPAPEKERLDVLAAIGYFLGSVLEKYHLRSEVEHTRDHDGLTGLKNRARFHSCMQAQQAPESLGVLIADINGLKQINEREGVRCGDELVRETARVLREQFGVEAAYRLDGDEFGVLCRNISGREFLDHVRAAKSELGQLLGVGVSIGYTWADNTPEPEALVEHATEMMEIEKQQYFLSVSNHTNRNRPQAIQELLQLLHDHCFAMYLQPKVDLRTGRIVGAEALVRLNHPQHGLLQPSRFIGALEEARLIRFVDLFIFESVCATLADWTREGMPLICISLNFSRITLLEENLAKTLYAILQRYGVTSEWIEIEITETIGNMERETLAELSRSLKRAGFRVSLDDFGAEYSSISILTVMKFDILKLDRSLVMHLAENLNSQTVVQYIVEMCRRMKIETIAEGVETEEQRILLEQMGCDVAQGYYYGPPVPREQFEELRRFALEHQHTTLEESPEEADSVR